ncbi:hypothetical protein ACFYY5_29265 [Nocardia elegans]|uniref:Uncharacterized protein n=1 Tax=Nocardia elegans TaxID=300029 RepID=A0ABW6TMA8_9NOCA
MKHPKLHDLRVWYTADPPRKAVHIHVPDMAYALTVLATLEAVTAYETVHQIRREVEVQAGVQRYEVNGDGGWDWYDVETWELDVTQEVLDAEAA